MHTELHIPKPDFGSNLTRLIVKLDHLRSLNLSGSTPKHIFFQLKDIFHLLESIGSTRIEGNHTTLAEYIETKITPDKHPTEDIREIQNNEAVMNFVEENSATNPITHAFIREIQKMIVKDLSTGKEGDHTPGQYRAKNVAISHSEHTPPDFIQVQGYMDELVDFINTTNEPQFDLLKTAIVHHRFAWIHPFGNGNGRTVRALTYAMLIRQGFNLEKGRLVNPTAVFCADRNRYYEMLEKADTGTDSDVLAWCEYVLDGLDREITNVNRLTDYEYLKNTILKSAIGISFERKLITEKEQKVLLIAINKEMFQSSDISHLFPGVAHTEISRFLRGMREKKLIRPIAPNARKYFIEISNGYLLRGIMKALDENDFLPLKNETE
ncbi:MAG: Fic family protein [Candidatus Moraniibacteriota bacterium]